MGSLRHDDGALIPSRGGSGPQVRRATFVRSKATALGPRRATRTPADAELSPGRATLAPHQHSSEIGASSAASILSEQMQQIACRVCGHASRDRGSQRASRSPARAAQTRRIAAPRILREFCSLPRGVLRASAALLPLESRQLAQFRPWGPHPAMRDLQLLPAREAPARYDRRVDRARMHEAIAPWPSPYARQAKDARIAMQTRGQLRVLADTTRVR